MKSKHKRRPYQHSESMRAQIKETAARHTAARIAKAQAPKTYTVYRLSGPLGDYVGVTSNINQTPAQLTRGARGTRIWRAIYEHDGLGHEFIRHIELTTCDRQEAKIFATACIVKYRTMHPHGYNAAPVERASNPKPEICTCPTCGENHPKRRTYAD